MPLPYIPFKTSPDLRPDGPEKVWTVECPTCSLKVRVSVFRSSVTYRFRCPRCFSAAIPRFTSEVYC
jgi:hypothetical protein